MKSTTIPRFARDDLRFSALDGERQKRARALSVAFVTGRGAPGF